jgi:sodium-dependent dicarboxylate transporter 2/3/5
MSRNKRDDHKHFFREKDGHHFHLIYSVKPSFVKFMNRLSAGLRGSIKLLVALAGFLFVAVLPLGISFHAQMSIAIFVLIAIMWTLEAIPMPVTALLVPALLTAFGIFETSDAFLPFANPVVYLILGSVILAGAVHKTGLDKRLLYPILLGSRGKVERFLLALMVVAFMFSMWISNTATVALLAPFAIGLASSVPDKDHSKRLMVLFLLGIGFASVIGGMATVVGSAPNAVTSALLAEQGSWTFLDWMIIGVPTATILLFLVWRLLLLALRPPKTDLDISGLKDEYAHLGRWTGGEKKTLVILILAITFWILGDAIVGLFGVPSSFMSTAIVALLAAVALFVTRTMTWQEARIVPWGVFLIIGAGLALGEALVNSGAADWMTTGLSSTLIGLPVLVTIFILAIVVVFISNFLNNTASAAVFIPILIVLANMMGESVYLVVLPIALVLSLSLITPIGTPPITLIYSTGRVPRRTLAKVGALVTLPAVLVCILMVYLMHSLGLL